MINIDAPASRSRKSISKLLFPLTAEHPLPPFPLPDVTGSISVCIKIKGTSYNIRELKFGSGHDTFGKKRVFYTFLSNRELVLLLGFIKNDNDYSAEIRLAEQLIDQLEKDFTD